MNADEFLRSLRDDEKWTVSQRRNRPNPVKSRPRAWNAFSPRAIIAELALVAVVAAGVVGVVSVINREPTSLPPAAKPTASPVPSPAVDGVATSADGDVTLLVARSPSYWSLAANISGPIGISDEGCVTVYGNVLIAPYGATVSPDGTSVSIPPYGSLSIGADLPDSSGGQVTYGGSDSSEREQKYIDLCGEGEYVTINPPGAASGETPGPPFFRSDDGAVTLEASTKPASGSQTAAVSGELKINSEGCVTVDDAVLIAPYGSSLSADGGSIGFPAFGGIEIGDKLPKTAGGFDTYKRSSANDSQLERIERCGEGDYVSINPFP